MLSHYRQTDLERWLTQIYADVGISHCGDLQERPLAEMLGIELYYRPCPSMRYESGNYRSITVNSTLPRPVQREHFFHELGHILRGHTGKQHQMNPAFRQLQEAQAEQFVLYAAMPFFLLAPLLLSYREWVPSSVLSMEFGVTRELADKRIAQIKRRIISEGIRRGGKTRKRKSAQ
ncbi:ImmA/IrrE family metallo-endopeptidase [Brevibacillus sp. FSL L8-0710]|uniref:ImmA/IrrE family metallo-endopeptidase n=1 Tax=Brevibacillus sp. FSL L8-0710 TaxID=2975313 RepID=UPI0030F7A7A7